MDIPGRVRALAAELERHFREVEGATKEWCRRVAEVRSQAAAATGDAAGAKAAADVADRIAGGQVG